MKPQPSPKTPSVLRLVGLGLAFAALAASGASAQGNSGTHVTAHCAGDVLSGTVRTGRDAASTRLELAVLAKRGQNSGFTATGMSQWMSVDGGHSYPFRFNIGRLSATAYRVDPPGDHSNTVPASSCAPGHQVPEAPLSLLLPVSVLGLGGLLVARNRRRRTAD
ncbi:MAG: hypothetical protein E6G65_02440 [Actinobacteria bacterium]|nr:MAG: hypothetical protein E6G65_02440 [Actinomycetota bacterium]